MASLRYRWDLTGNHLKFFRAGVTSSNFVVPETMRAAKFCTPCSLRILRAEPEYSTRRMSNNTTC